LTHRSRLPRPELIHIRLSMIGWTTAGCGALVVFLAIGFLVPLFGSLHQLARLALINGPLVAAYLILCCVVITRHFGRHVSETLLWVREDRPPDEREHRDTLGLAIYAVKLDALAWIIAGAVFGVIDSVLFSPGTGALVLGTVWLGSTTWPRGCASASGSATCSAARSARTWRGSP